MSWCLSVDLGTSFCCAAIADERGVELLEVAGERRIPSTVLLSDEGTLLAGTFAQRGVGRRPDCAERNPKRYVGRGPMLLGGRPVTAAHALGALLDLFLTEARHQFDGTVPDEIVLTHPVTWDDGQRDVLRSAAALSAPGVPCRLLPEPVAAAWHHAHDTPLSEGDTVAIYDLGGGTFDVAVLGRTSTGFDLLGSPSGDPEIGGEAFDERVFAHFGTQLASLAPEWWDQVSRSPQRRWLAAAADLMAEARRGKEALSAYPTSEHYVQGADADVSIARGVFESEIAADVARTVHLLDDALARAGVANRNPAVFVTGGAGRVPLVQTSLRERYGSRVHTRQDPKAAVALGGARWARDARNHAAQPTAVPSAASPADGSDRSAWHGPVSNGTAPPTRVPTAAAPPVAGPPDRGAPAAPAAPAAAPRESPAPRGAFRIDVLAAVTLTLFAVLGPVADGAGRDGVLVFPVAALLGGAVRWFATTPRSRVDIVSAALAVGVATALAVGTGETFIMILAAVGLLVGLVMMSLPRLVSDPDQQRRARCVLIGDRVVLGLAAAMVPLYLVLGLRGDTAWLFLVAVAVAAGLGSLRWTWAYRRMVGVAAAAAAALVGVCAIGIIAFPEYSAAEWIGVPVLLLALATLVVAALELARARLNGETPHLPAVPAA